MKVLNIHERTVAQPIGDVRKLFSSLATKNDLIWPAEKWPAMRFRDGLRVDSTGGHGPIRYTVEQYDPNGLVQFKFTAPKGFNGRHKFEITEMGVNMTHLRHTIEMETSGMGTIAWLFGIRWLHDALIEDAFDKVENHFIHPPKATPWGFWVRILRRVLGG